MAYNEGSSSLKELFCYFHVGGKFIYNDEGRIQYSGGGIKLRRIKEGTTLSDLRLMISEWLGIDCNTCDMKYTVSFDEKTLINLNDDGEVGNLFDYNDRSGHIYIAEKEIDNASEILDDLQVREKTFAHADAFKEAVYKYSIAHKFEFEYVKNAKHHMSVKCKVLGCPWKLTANAIGKKTPLLRVTTFIEEHYHSAQDNLQVSHGGRSSLTSSILVDELRNHIDKPPCEIRKTLLTEYGVSLTYKQAYRAKQKAMEEIQGRPEHSYMLIPWICRRLKEADDKTVAEWEASWNNVFERVFIAYGSCIEGFMAGARHVLYVDGTHLSGPYKGTMLSASGYDADNQMLPFAIAIVNRETFED